MQRIIILLFFALPSAWAISDEDKLTTILSEQNQTEQSIKQLEALHRSTKQPAVALQSAFVLAQAPAKWLSLNPYFYAEFYLKNDSCHKSEDCFSLYRAAGDGYFEKLDFKKASEWYEKGIADSKLEDKDREYLVYKNAWSYLNGKNPSKAFAILNNWLQEHTLSLLREPMMTDLGRIYGEMFFTKKMKVSSEKIKMHSNQDSKNFVEGLVKSFQRLKNTSQNRQLLYDVLLQVPWVAEGLQALWGWEPFRQAPACEVMILESAVPEAFRKEAVWSTYLQKCAIFVSDSVKVKREDKTKLAQWMSEVPLDPMGLWGRAKLYSQLEQQSKSCEQFSQMAPQLLTKEVEPWTASWLVDYIKTCAQGVEAPMFTKTIRELRVNIQKNQLMGIVIEAPSVAADLKRDLLKAWGEEDQQKVLESMAVFLSQQKPEEHEALLSEICPLSRAECKSLWWKYLDEGGVDNATVQLVTENWGLFKEKILADENSKKQWMSALVVSSAKLPSENDEFIVTAKNLRESFQQGSEVKVPSEFLTLPVVQDLQQLQTLGSLTLPKESMSDEELIGAIANFQKAAGRMTKQKWSHEELKKRAQQKVSEQSLFWQEQVLLRGKTPAEKKEWKQVAQLIKKWGK